MENLLHLSSKKITLFVLGIIAILAVLYILFLSAPANFPNGIIISIEPGMSLRAVSLKLKNENVIRSRTAFEAFVIMNGGEKHVVSTDYLFENNFPVFEVARRIGRGESHLAPIKVAIPEGFSNKEIADTFASKLPAFDKVKFLELVKGKEGYLFPDTYFFFSTSNEEDAIKSMSVNFEKKILPLRGEMLKAGKSEKDVITMASIIEGEAKADDKRDDRALISGILWRRISIGMALQADAAPETYKAKGLPKSPIGNPGLLAIGAAIHPTSSPYLYYLHDKEGNIHFARSFAEHTANKLKYLR
jgi:UPF0755 protein